MDAFEKKYGILEDEKVRLYHQSRRMFCIHQDKLFIAEPNLPYSHAAWFELEGWISKVNDELMKQIVRGIVDSRGDVYFYVGYDFDVNDQAETVFFKHLGKLVEKLGLNLEARIFGGLIKQKPGITWPSRKEYGQIKNYL